MSELKNLNDENIVNEAQENVHVENPKKKPFSIIFEENIGKADNESYDVDMPINSENNENQLENIDIQKNNVDNVVSDFKNQAIQEPKLSNFSTFKSNLQFVNQQLFYYLALSDNLNKEINRLKEAVDSKTLKSLEEARTRDRIDRLLISSAELQYSTELNYSLLDKYKSRIFELQEAMNKESNTTIKEDLHKQIELLIDYSKSLEDLLKSGNFAHSVEKVVFDPGKKDEVLKQSKKRKVENVSDNISKEKSYDKTTLDANNIVSEEKINTNSFEDVDSVDSNDEIVSTNIDERIDSFQNALESIINADLTDEELKENVIGLFKEYEDIRNINDMNDLFSSIEQELGITNQAETIDKENNTYKHEIIKNNDVPIEQININEKSKDPNEILLDRMVEFQVKFKNLLDSDILEDVLADKLEELANEYQDLKKSKAMSDIFEEMQNAIDQFKKPIWILPKKNKNINNQNKSNSNDAIQSLSSEVKISEKKESENSEYVENLPETRKKSPGRIAFEEIYQTPSWESKEVFVSALKGWIAKYKDENPEFTNWVLLNYSEYLS